MKRKALSILMMLVMFCALLPVSAYAQDNGTETNKKVETVQSVPQNGEVKGKGKTVTHYQFRNVETGVIAPEAIIVGTISCDDGGGYWLVCSWNVTSTSRITRINLGVDISNGAIHGYSYVINTPAYQIGNVADEYVGAPGVYSAILTGTVTTFDGFYQLVPAKADYTTVY
ncbi:hypothetical protein [Tumebacillus permanentifrigoris]|uniref:DUF5626 domain-containing protein n=1 Tax=Tumebacillus permanentifrigoris TaxID=378543 RepID=A0A316D1Z3_9BACL|nr:hypothetical protein [Tumebacillus permanentifrigoris]PWJ99240.1 hypothetical protein C7459_1542 [Tumebacillus permanentifrigoris]